MIVPHVIHAALAALLLAAAVLAGCTEKPTPSGVLGDPLRSRRDCVSIRT